MKGIVAGFIQNDDCADYSVYQCVSNCHSIGKKSGAIKLDRDVRIQPYNMA